LYFGFLRSEKEGQRREKRVQGKRKKGRKGLKKFIRIQAPGEGGGGRRREERGREGRIFYIIFTKFFS
jgi:hypothetical protein